MTGIIAFQSVKEENKKCWRVDSIVEDSVLIGSWDPLPREIDSQIDSLSKRGLQLALPDNKQMAFSFDSNQESLAYQTINDPCNPNYNPTGVTVLEIHSKMIILEQKWDFSCNIQTPLFFDWFAKYRILESWVIAQSLTFTTILCSTDVFYDVITTWTYFPPMTE